MVIRKSSFCQKVTVHKEQKSLHISNLKKPACASKRDVLELVTLQYVLQFFSLISNGIGGVTMLNFF